MRFKILSAVFAALTILPSCQPGKETARPPVRLAPEVQGVVEEVLAPLDAAVTLELFLGGPGETKAEEARALADLVARVSPRVTVAIRDIARHPAADPGTDHGPLFEIRGKAPGTLRYYGFPERKEVRPFAEGILAASGARGRLSPEVRDYVARLDKDVVIRIFTTPD